MASEIHRERVYGNFKPERGARLKAKQSKKSAAERREGMSAAHLDDIRSLPCCGCFKASSRVQAHHLLATKSRGMALRSTDKDAVPLCYKCHDELHRQGSRNEFRVFAAWGIKDPLQLAADLWRSRGDPEKMRAVLNAHKLIGRP